MCDHLCGAANVSGGTYATCSYPKPAHLRLVDPSVPDDFVEDYDGDRDLVIEGLQDVGRWDSRMCRGDMLSQGLLKQITHLHTERCKHVADLAAAEVIEQHAIVDLADAQAR
jgi:hypothetical protein